MKNNTLTPLRAQAGTGRLFPIGDRQIKKKTRGGTLFGVFKLAAFSIFLAAAAFTGRLYGQFDDLGAGARAIGMANTFTALSDDVYAIYYNPAGLSRIDWKELGVDYSKLYWGLDDNSKLGSGFIGYAWRVKDFTKLKLDGTLGLGWQYFTLSGYYSENCLTFAYSRYVMNSQDKGKLSAGLKFKALSKSFGKTLYTENAVNLDTNESRGGRDPVFGNGYSKMKPSYDLGLLWEITKHHSLGMSLADFTQPDMGLASEDKVSMATKFGYAYTGRDITAASDFVYRDMDFILSMGVEKWFMKKTFALRGGLGIGSREYANLACGMSWNYSGLLRFDYSFNYPLNGISDFSGSHRMSMNMKFGAPGIQEIALEEKIKQLELELEKKKGISEEDTKRLEEEKNRIQKELMKKNMKKYWDLGMLYYKQEKYDDSILQFEKILSLEPGHEKAQNLINKVKETKKEKMQKHWDKAMEYYNNEDYEKCVPHFEAILKIDPQHEQSKRILGRLEEIVRKSKLKNLWESGVIYYKQGDYEKAVSQFEEILKIDPAHAQSKTFIKRAEKEMLLLEDAKKKKAKLESDRKDAEKYYTEGLKAYSSGNMKEAIEKLGKASELSPGNEEIKNALTNAAKEGKLREGVKKDVQMWYNEGMKYFLQEDYDGAIVEFKKILDMNPDHPQAQEMIKKCRAKKK